MPEIPHNLLLNGASTYVIEVWLSCLRHFCRPTCCLHLLILLVQLDCKRTHWTFQNCHTKNFGQNSPPLSWSSLSSPPPLSSSRSSLSLGHRVDRWVLITAKVGTFWGFPYISLCASGAQLRRIKRNKQTERPLFHKNWKSLILLRFSFIKKVLLFRNSHGAPTKLLENVLILTHTPVYWKTKKWFVADPWDRSLLKSFWNISEDIIITLLDHHHHHHPHKHDDHHNLQHHHHPHHHHQPHHLHLHAQAHPASKHRGKSHILCCRKQSLAKNFAKSQMFRKQNLNKKQIFCDNILIFST